jgi:hypothetical protein
MNLWELQLGIVLQLPVNSTTQTGRIPDKTQDSRDCTLGSDSWLWRINGVDREGTRFWPDAPHDTMTRSGTPAARRRDKP